MFNLGAWTGKLFPGFMVWVGQDKAVVVHSSSFATDLASVESFGAHVMAVNGIGFALDDEGNLRLEDRELAKLGDRGVSHVCFENHTAEQVNDRIEALKRSIEETERAAEALRASVAPALCAPGTDGRTRSRETAAFFKVMSSRVDELKYYLKVDEQTRERILSRASLSPEFEARAEREALAYLSFESFDRFRNPVR